MKRRYARFLTFLCVSGFLAYSPVVLGQNPQSSSPANTADFSIRALRAEPGKASLYDLRFTTRDTLDPLAEMTFVFPRNFDLSLLQVASSTSINGGFKILREGNLVRIRRTGLGETILPGTPVELKLGLIISPPNLSASHDLSFEVRSATGRVMLNQVRLPIQFIVAQ